MKLSLRITSCLLALLLLALTVPAVSAVAEDTLLLDINATWRYLDDGTDPAASLSSRTAWTAADFDDSAWKQSSGAAKFGAKRGAIASMGSYTPTVLLNQYTTGTTNVPTFFFRTSFTLDSLPEGALALNGTLAYDDAAIVYVNGVKVAAFHEPEGGFATNLSYGGSSAEAPIKTTFSVDASCLKQGKNVIAVELHQVHASSSDIYFEMSSLTLAPFTASNLSLTVGADETERNLTWYSDTDEPGKVQYAEKTGTSFPAQYTEKTASVKISEGRYVNTATLTGLKPGKVYQYRIVAGTLKTAPYTFKTNAEGDFSFLFISDAQIGTQSAVKETAQWKEALKKATEMFPDSSLLVSGGDQVNWGHTESQFIDFLSPAELASLALAPTIGNHDNMGDLFSDHFALPNVSEYGTSTAGSNYWYTYNNVLFIHLNTENPDTEEHRAFMEEVLATATDVDWKIVVMHHSVYSAGDHSQDAEVLALRETLPTIFSELGIDAVLQGHDHTYVRSYMIDKGVADTTLGKQTSVLNPKGILYITANTVSGSKYYSLINNAVINSYAAFKAQEKSSSFSRVSITPYSFKIVTYRTADGSVLDSFEIRKTRDIPGHTHDLTHITGTPASCTEEGVAEHYECLLCGRLFEDAQAATEMTTTVLPKTGHTPGEKEIVPPTATESGSETVHCLVCGNQIYRKNLAPSVLGDTSSTTATDAEETPVPSDTDTSSDTGLIAVLIVAGGVLIAGAAVLVALLISKKKAAVRTIDSEQTTEE